VAGRTGAMTASPPADPTAAVGSRTRFEPALEGIRGFAVLAVVLFHASALAGRPGWFTGGFLGVSVFFVISGFLMVTVLLAEADRGAAPRPARFAARRVQRLMAASLAVVLVSVLGALPSWSAWPGFHASDALAGIWGAMNWQLVHLGETSVVRGLGPLAPYWSLAVEWQFYALLWICTLVVRRRRQSTERVLLVFAVAAWAVGTATMLFRDGSSIRREFGTDYRIAELATGMLVALAMRRWARRSTAPAAAPADRAIGVVVGGVATLLLALGVLFASFDPPWLLSGGFAVVAAVSGALVVCAVRVPVWRRVWSWPPLMAVGRISYALYLVHWPIGLLVIAHVSSGGLSAVAANVALSVVAAVVLYRWVEHPVRQREAEPRRVLMTGLVAALAVSVLAIAVLP
jgi:peptidoglycan/LPS O-acetylase OafA/YrhL